MSTTKIFVSHSHRDAKSVEKIQRWFKSILLDGVDFFISSDASSPNLGAEWFKVLLEEIDSSAMAFVVISPRSLNSSWLYFEAGAAMFSKIPVIPICLAGVGMDDLPSPLNQFQAAEIETKKGQKALLEIVANSSNLDTPKKFKKLRLNSTVYPVIDLDVLVKS